MNCGIALNIGSIVCSCMSTQKGTILKATIVDFLNLLNRRSYRHSLVFFFCVGPHSGVERCEKLFCPCSVVTEFVTYVVAHLYNDY